MTLGFASAWNCTPGTKQAMYDVKVLQRSAAPDNGALISHANGTSDFNYSFNTAWFSSGGQDGLVVRNVECAPNHHSCAGVAHPEWSNAGALAVVRANLSASGGSPLTAQHVSQDRVTWAGGPAPRRSNVSQWGAADPRMTYRPANGNYYLTWDNCTANCYPQRNTMLSVSKDPFDPAGWTLVGPLLGEHPPYTGGASLLFRDAGAPPAASTSASGGGHLAFVSDSNTANAIMIADSTHDDGLRWRLRNRSWANGTLMSGRPGCWDEAGVAPGPQPERLSSGDYLLVYNIDTGFPYKPNPLGRCSVGWAILDGADPTVVVARAEQPLLVPEFPWETCAEGGKGYLCQEPMVAFATGMKPLGGDEFLVVYGGADTDVGAARIAVHVHGGTKKAVSAA